jgi:hypothetical protein
MPCIKILAGFLSYYFFILITIVLSHVKPVRSPYVMDTVCTRGIRTMAIGGLVSLEGGGYCGGLHCRHTPVLRTCGRTSDYTQATPPPWCGEHHRSHFAITGGPMTIVCSPRPALCTILY